MKKLSHNLQVRSLQVINHLLFVIGIIWSIQTDNLIYFAISIITYWIIGVLGINIGFHRLISHRSFTTNRWLEKMLAIIGCITTVGSPIAWAAIHRQHHRYCEKDGDPHSPFLLGNLKSWFGFWNIKTLDLKLVNDLRKDQFYRSCHKNYFYLILIYCSILYLINPVLIIFMYAIPACLCLHSTSTIIVIAHKHGYVSHYLKNDKSKNSWIANLITLGEGWHNNHHARPYKWNNREKWWEWDIPALIIRFIKK
jgi:fatty-acid desaturase